MYFLAILLIGIGVGLLAMGCYYLYKPVPVLPPVTDTEGGEESGKVKTKKKHGEKWVELAEA